MLRGRQEVLSVEEAARRARIESDKKVAPGQGAGPQVSTGPSLDTSFENGGVEVTCSGLIGGRDYKVYTGINVSSAGSIVSGKDGAIGVFEIDPENIPANPMEHLKRSLMLSRGVVNKTRGTFWVNVEKRGAESSVDKDDFFPSQDAAPKAERPKAAMVLITHVSRISVISGEVSTIFSKSDETGREFLLVGKAGAKLSVELSPGVHKNYEFTGSGLIESKSQENTAPAAAQGRTATPKSTVPQAPVAPAPTPSIEVRLRMNRGLRASCNYINPEGSSVMGLGTSNDGYLHPFGSQGIPVYNFSEIHKPEGASRANSENLLDVYVFPDPSSPAGVSLNIGSKIPDEERGRSEGILLNIERFYKVHRVYSGDARIIASSTEPGSRGRHIHTVLIGGPAKLVVQERPDGEQKVYAYQGGNFVPTNDNPNVVPVEGPGGGAAPGQKPGEEKKAEKKGGGILGRFRRN